MATSFTSSYAPVPTVRPRRAEGVFQSGPTYIQVDGLPVGVFDREVGHGLEKSAFDVAKLVASGQVSLVVEHHGPRVGTLVELRELQDRVLFIWRLDDPSWQWLVEQRPEVSFLASLASRSRDEGGVPHFQNLVLLHAAPSLRGGWGKRHRVVELLSRAFDAPAATGRSHGVREDAPTGSRVTAGEPGARFARLHEPAPAGGVQPVPAVPVPVRPGGQRAAHAGRPGPLRRSS